MGTYIVMKKFNREKTSESSHTIAYEIKKMNKMVVAEQQYSDVFSHENSWYLPGFENYFSFDKKILLLVNAKIQATYNLSQMKIEIDSARKTIYINEIPELEIKTYPDIQFYDVEQSTFNTFKKDELNRIKDQAVAEIEKSIDEDELKKQAHSQLIENLGEIYLLAKAHNWKLVDNTPYSKELSQKFY